MGGENQHLGYLNMLGSAGGIECHVGNVIACQWLNATVNIVGTLGGDDTVFVVMRDTETALELAEETRAMLK